MGDTATLIGSDGHETITVEEVAQKAGTIAYEVTCSVGRRVQRLYLGGENLELASQRAADVRTPAPLARRPLPREAGRELPGG